MGDERADIADIAERVKNIIVEQLAIEKSKVIDDEFEIAIPNEPAEEFLTVRDPIDFVVAQQ